ncbi:hypothetical protein L226DRAFT_545097 [Lentinus tigrinus ALCF2SS1-7]|uniref:Nucleotidyltransferase n=1 Tax=Lentinus tigrinus ALCF2SS1-6 TaxID=1328759 RepID=A0A5C2SBU9_9APHY|nr:hypothetical protein L227DRAFT_586049 [Lentinus tigrinus ALCF2SS1-6]RPD75831.1 hypothetical protein L226DRAFT_545097 [Lentinus tigrinus ALCF2SS1-7]
MSPTTSQILDIARKAIDIFAKHGLKCCLTGGAASLLYGVSRTPSDVDLVVLTTAYGQETLKEMLVRADPQFYLVPSKTYLATYKVLWYRLTAGSYAYTKTHIRAMYDCKVDILVPEGDMNIPNVPQEHIVMLSGLPVMPLILQLLLKLQAWADHRVATRSDLQAKQYVDIRDIDALLAIAVRVGARAKDASWLPQQHFSKARERLSRYTFVASRATASQWKELGFSWS